MTNPETVSIIVWWVGVHDAAYATKKSSDVSAWQHLARGPFWVSHGSWRRANDGWYIGLFGGGRAVLCSTHTSLVSPESWNELILDTRWYPWALSCFSSHFWMVYFWTARSYSPAIGRFVSMRSAILFRWVGQINIQTTGPKVSQQCNKNDYLLHPSVLFLWLVRVPALYFALIVIPYNCDDRSI